MTGRIHPDLAAPAFLIGVWRGRGQGRYPTIDPFEYLEEAVYVPGPGKPFIAYTQRTRSAADDRPLHAETGYVRPRGTNRAELVIAQPTGIVEVHAGTVGGCHIDFRTTIVGGAPTAVDVSSVRRRIRVDGDTMRYRMEMAAAGQPMQLHLEAELILTTGR